MAGSNFRLDEAVALLERTPSTLDALLRGLPEPWTTCDEGPQTWSPFLVVGHLIHGEKTDWIPRVQRILDHGEGVPFEPFDRNAHLHDTQGRRLPDLIDDFSILRRANLDRLIALQLTEPDLDRTGRHPELGPVTMRQLLATWVAHDLDQLQQIARVMARRYAEDCGPCATLSGTNSR